MVLVVNNGAVRVTMGPNSAVVVVFKSDDGHASVEKLEEGDRNSADVAPSHLLKASCEVVLGDVRVQALSPTLVRVEPKGPHGFEDRKTFMVVNRSMGGVPVSKREVGNGTTNISTAYFSVLLQRDKSFVVIGTDGKALYSSVTVPARNLLHWPAPLGAAHAYAIEDRPRFVPPEWAPEPSPAGTSLAATSGYDFRNNLPETSAGDVYVFLLGNSLEEWWNSRDEFLRLTGPTPTLPDYAYGTWFTTWHQFSEADVKDRISHWDSGRFPLDIFGLDMNWRRTNGTCCGAPACRSQRGTEWANATFCEDHKYLANTTDFPDSSNHGTPQLRAWLQWMKGRGIHTYLNDHPFPRDQATTPKETAFRWNSLTEFLSNGLSFWWFDHGWIFSIPPPNVPINDTRYYGKEPGPWQGLSSEVWGSHIYHETMRRFATHQTNNGTAVRTLALSRNGGGNWRVEMASESVAGVPAHHRFPVWWNGDGVPLNGSVNSMVDEAIHDFRPFVHSDCGGGSTTGTALMRWTAHCVLGTILRFHGADHSPWQFDNTTQGVIRRYLQMRYALAPSLVSAGQTTQRCGLPLAARCDLFWPEYAAARRSDQYISTFADALVAPLGETETTRSVFIPPGEWEDAWDGSTLSGPRTITNVTRPFAKIPMWHRRGGLVVTTSSTALRIEEQDWSELIIEGWPSSDAAAVSREVFEPDRSTHADAKPAAVQLRTDGAGTVHVTVSEAAVPRAWVVRLHLAPNERLSNVAMDGGKQTLSVRHIDPMQDCAAAHFPFGGAGSGPACGAGPVAEVSVPPTQSGWSLRATVVDRFWLSRNLSASHAVHVPVPG